METKFTSPTKLAVVLCVFCVFSIAENTVFIFIADHGSEMKGSLYKSRGTEVPCIMRWPAGMKKGVRCHELIQNTDFVPTWFELAGARLPDKYKIDGVSIAPLFTNPKKPDRGTETVSAPPVRRVCPRRKCRWGRLF